MGNSKQLVKKTIILQVGMELGKNRMIFAICNADFCFLKEGKIVWDLKCLLLVNYRSLTSNLKEE